MRPKLFSAAAAAFLLSLTSFDSAVAVGVCSPGFHRNSYGRCHPNAARTVVVPAAPVVVAPEPVFCREGFHWDSTLNRCVLMYTGGA
jgi:hypothetical protein